MILGGLVAALALVPGARMRGGRVGAGHGGDAELSVKLR
jgi:hypothetical protein